jgi:hypothetical protein
MYVATDRFYDDNATLIKEAVFTKLLGTEVKLWNPDGSDWKPEKVIWDLDDLKAVTLQQLHKVKYRTASGQEWKDVLSLDSKPDLHEESQSDTSLFNSPAKPDAGSLSNPTLGENEWVAVEGMPKISFQVIVCQAMARSNAVPVSMPAIATVRDLRCILERITGVPPDSQSLWFRGRPLIDDECTLTSFDIEEDSMVEMGIRLKGGAPPIGLNAELFDDGYNYDFTNVDDNGKSFRRGGEEYKRPVGWKRYAVNVVNV